jgi:glycosyltransferase involved in cell wall biosynthesis
MDQGVDVTVVVPVYNSEKSVGEVVRRCSVTLEKLGKSHEFVLVDDGSRDGSWRVLETLAETMPNVTAIRMMRNFGQHNALLAGTRVARGAFVVTIDDDLQHPPEELPKLFDEMMRADADVVYGTPRELTHSTTRNILSWAVKVVLRDAIGAETARRISAFRLFRTAIREAFADYNHPFVSLDVLLTWGTSRFTHVETVHARREIGKSNYTMFKLIAHTLTIITGFSTLPLRIASVIGFAFTIVGVGILIKVLLTFLIYGRAVPGFAFLASVITIFAGAQLFVLGIIGEYLARAHVRLLGRPAYVIREKLSAERIAGPRANVTSEIRESRR